ncbi:MAG: undecaprenyl diphosphate synthase family protein [Aeropyrum sp.]|nr:undecaprenyl diphosphate synthase family protein [Aeropyrum sp.]MCE4616856.1 undecaprenyl diphosphate synthase family protein [Aeropyrum sp.]
MAYSKKGQFAEALGDGQVMKPISIGIIPDGNRRWASKSGLNSLSRAYYYGYRNLRNILNKINESYGFVRSTYVYVLSRDNCSKRTSQELSIIFSIMKSRILDDIREVSEKGVSTLIVGDLNHPSIPRELKSTLTEYHYDYYMSNGGLPRSKTLVLGLCYDPLWEIKTYPPELMPSFNLREIDLIIRTGGEKRLSGFFPILSRYAELYFIDKLWPEFDYEDLKNAFHWFSSRRRPMGR